MTGELLQFGLLCFVSIFTMVNPLPVVPIYLAMTAGLPAAQARRVAFRSTLTALVVMIFFALTGQFIFRFFNISLDAMRIVGGVLFFGIGYEMLQGRPTRTKHDEETDAEYAEDISITPLGTPMLSGPGTITSVILLMNESDSLAERGVLFGAMFTVALLTYALLVGGQGLLTRLGTSGHKVITRIMGLIVMVIAVEFFFAGLRGLAKGFVQGTG
ncbi:MAG TPA: MarC family protein [Candidatus Eisenbacteria bacterium]|nr:MarC family protein [Candidatus Eisenbacteria bacterium]